MYIFFFSFFFCPHALHSVWLDKMIVMRKKQSLSFHFIRNLLYLRKSWCLVCSKMETSDLKCHSLSVRWKSDWCWLHRELTYWPLVACYQSIILISNGDHDQDLSIKSGSRDKFLGSCMDCLSRNFTVHYKIDQIGAASAWPWPWFMSLSEQVLHLWLETLCSCVEVVEKWYHPWSYLRSPGWVQIKCELRSVSCSPACCEMMFWMCMLLWRHLFVVFWYKCFLCVSFLCMSICVLILCGLFLVSDIYVL